MQTKNQASIIRKTLYAIMLLGIFFSTFGAGNLSSARAQEGSPEEPTATTEPPTQTSTPTETTALELPAEASSDQAIPTDQIIIKYKADSNANVSPMQADQMQHLNNTAGITLTYLRAMSGDANVLGLPERLPLEQVLAISMKLMALPEVEYAEPDQIAFPMLAPNDPLYTNQWDLFGAWGINAPAAWDITTGSSSIVVAVIDTGITNHVDLFNRTVPGYDFITEIPMANDGNGRDSDPSDPGDWITTAENSSGYFAGCQVSDSSWHGTHTAGTIGASGNNSGGIAGINRVSKILPIRVLGKCGGYTSDIVDGMRWSAGLSVSGVPSNPNPARVLNMSLGGSGACTPAYQSAVNEITSAGAVIVVSAGNNNADASGFRPANCNGVITVAATDNTGYRASYSNYGTSVEISAPGGAQSYANDPAGILSTLNTGTTSPIADTYIYYEGTSMAAPHVSGVVSLMLSVNPSLTPAQVLQKLQSSVKAFPAGGTCNTSNCGSGIVNAGAAVSASVSLSTYRIYLPLVLKNYSPLAGAFNKSAPANAATNQPASPTLSWGASSGATSYEYCIDTTNDNACTTTWTSTASTSAGLSGLTPTTVYYWQVRAINSAGTTYADGGTWWSFTIAASPPPGIVNGSFESGSTGWTEYSTHGWTIIVTSFPTGVTAHSGSYAAWLGGELDDLSYIQQQITISTGAPYLVYWQWIASSDACGYDFGGVLINGSVVDAYNLCSGTSTGGWVTHSVNLSAYAGQSVTLQIRAETDSSNNSNLFVDDVTFQATSLALGSTDGIAPNLEVSTTQGKLGTPPQTKNPQGVKEERLLNPMTLPR